MLKAKVIEKDDILCGRVQGNKNELKKAMTGQIMGVGIKSIELLHSEGIIDTYRITMTNGTTFDYIVKNGSVGPRGERGQDGYTPVKGVDYFDGKDGKDGKDAELTPQDIEHITEEVEKKVKPYDDTKIKADIQDLQTNKVGKLQYDTDLGNALEILNGHNRMIESLNYDNIIINASLERKAEKSEIPTKTSDLTNDSNYITSSYHDSTKQDVISDLSTIRSGASKGATALQSVPSEYAKKSDIPSVPTKTSELTNDSDYITSSYHDSTKADKSDVPNIIIINEDMVTVEKDATKGVAPYSTSYGYTNITVDIDKSRLIEGLIIAPLVDTKMVVASANRNVRIRFGEDDVWHPVMGTTSILAGSSYFTKTIYRFYQYRTNTRSEGAFHLFTDSNTTYSAMTQAEFDAGTSTTARLVTPKLFNDFLASKGYALESQLFSGDYNDLTNKPTLFSGNYDDLVDKPTIPRYVSQLYNDRNYIIETDVDNKLENYQPSNIYMYYGSNRNAQAILDNAIQNGINYYVVDMDNYTFAVMDRADMSDYVLCFESEKFTYTISLIDNSWNRLEKSIPTDAHINNLIDAKINGLETLANEIEGVI